MKHTLSRFWLLWLCLILSFSIINTVKGVDTGVVINPSEPMAIWYKSRLHTLRLWSETSNSTLKVANWKLKFTNGLVAWQDPIVGNNAQYAVIWWWKSNKIGNNNYAWIWWWESNTADGEYAVIWWWKRNTAQWNNAVIVGWELNQADALSVVVWGNKNKALNWGVVLGWQNNTGYKNSLALGNNSTANEGSFAWNGTAREDSARVNASNWILIGTTTKIDGVNLVVNGAVRVWWNNDVIWTKWEIRYASGCFYVFDGEKWHIMNRWNEKNENDITGTNDECKAFPTESVAKYCEFGNTILWEWDNANGYVHPNDVTCTSRTLICYDRRMYVKRSWVNQPDLSQNADEYYAYCYTINKN